jgi:hypothetical protein
VSKSVRGLELSYYDRTSKQGEIIIMKLSYIAAGLTSSGIIAVSAMGVASAATNNSSVKNPNVGSSGIPRTVFKQDHLEAASQVLNTTTANIQTAHKDKTFAQLLKNAGLTRTTYRQKLKTQLTTDLENQGYTQDQVTIALQQKTISHLRHHHK